jgi:hypothetical protein
MAIDVNIRDGEGNNGTAAVVIKKDIPAGMLTYTEPYVDVIDQTKAMVNATYGADWNVNASFSGTPEVVHNGTDSVAWTGSALTGTWTFDSTAQAQAGTKSVDATATVNNDEAQFEDSTPISNADYTALTGYIYITGWPTSGTKEVTVRNRLAGVNAGDELNLSDYIDTTLLNTWQSFTIPIADFNMPTQNIDQLIVKTVDIGGGAAPDYYLDTIQWEETGGAIFSVEPDAESIYTVSELNITIADAFNSALTNASHQNIPYDALLGVSALTDGINFRLTTNDIVRFNSSFKQHIDFMGFPGAKCQSGGDGTNTWVTYTYTFDPPFRMDARTKDKFEMTISEDLSGLLYARSLVRGGKQEL